MLIRLLLGPALLGAMIAPGIAAVDHAKTPATSEGTKLSQAAEEPKGENAESVNPFDFKQDLAVWTAVVFLVLLLILRKFAWRPLAEGLDKREREVAGQIAQAEQANRTAQELLAQYEQKLANARNDVRGILDQARRDGEALSREMLEKAKAEAKAEQQRALRQIDSATAGALKELAERGATLAVALAGKILRAQLSPKDHAQLIQQSVADFVAQPPSKN